MFVWIYRDQRIIYSLENISLCFLKFMLISSITCCFVEYLHPGYSTQTPRPASWKSTKHCFIFSHSSSCLICSSSAHIATPECQKVLLHWPKFLRSLDTALVPNALDSIKPPKGCTGIHTYIMTEVWRVPSAAAKKHILSVPHLSALIFVCGQTRVKKTAGTLCKVHFKIIEWLLYSK